MRIDSAGEVWVGNGTTNASPASASLRATGGSGTDIAGGNFDISSGRSTGNAAGGSIRFWTSPAGSTGSSANALAERVRIDSAGNVGIGTSSPTSFSTAGRALVVSSASASLSSGTVAAFDATTGGGADVGGVLALGGNDGVTSARTFGSIRGGKENGTSGNYASYLAFATRANGGSMTERMRITSAGEVGIGRTPSSGYMLDIDHPTDTRIGLYNAGTRIGILQAASSLFSISGVSTNPIALLTNGAERARIKSNGQVRFIPLAADPANAEAGDVYYNSGTNKLRVYNGTAWVDLH